MGGKLDGQSFWQSLTFGLLIGQENLRLNLIASLDGPEIYLTAFNSRHFYQHQTVLKQKNLDQNMQKAFGLASLINSPYEEPTPTLAVILYDLSEADFPSEIIFEDTDKLKPTTMDKIRKAYTEDEIVQKIIQAKLKGLQKVPYDITKNHFKLEL